METEDPQQKLEDLFHEALERSELERTAFLEEQCAGDAELLDRITALLEGHRVAATEFLAGAPSESNVDPSTPSRIGRYTIQRPIGEGGMGIVYEARQENPDRLVALKVVRPEMSTPALLRRFEHEAAVLARLQHPGIAQIYEAGTAQEEDGGVTRPFFAMELIRGESLIEYASERKLGITERQLLMARICDAVQHAHQNGVLHRDLKPANILVSDEESEGGTARPHPRVLDFGLARMVDAEARGTILTEHGQILGTLAYMSPEQVSGFSDDLDTRCDVYALGVILHQLLTGNLPYDLAGKPLPEAARIIAETEPRSIARSAVGLSTDLATVVGKALEKDRERRYVSAADMAADLRRVVANEPILARPPTATYLLQKFARRHRVLMMAAVLVLVSLVGGLIAALHGRSQALEAEQTALSEKAAADLARGEEERQRVTAEAQAARARRTTRFLQDMLSNVKPEQARGRELTVREVLDATAIELETDMLEEPEVEAAIRFTVGEAYAALDHHDEAKRMFERALEIRREKLTWLSHDTADILDSLGMLRLEQGRFEESLTLLDQALQVQRSAGPDDDLAQVRIQENRGNALQKLGRFDQVLPILRELLERRLEMFGEDHELVAVSRHNLAVVLTKTGQFDEARPLIEDAYRWFVDRQGRLHPNTHDVLTSIARLRLNTGDRDEARDYCLEGLDVARELFGEDHTKYAETLTLYAEILLKRSEYAESEEALRQALRIRESRLGPDSLEVAITLTVLSRSVMRQGRHEEVESSLRRALSIQRDHEPEAGIDLAWTLQVLAQTVLKLDRKDEAEALQREAVEKSQTLLGHDHPTTLQMLSHLGNVLYSRGDIAGCARVSAQVLEAQVRLLGDDHPDVAYATLNLSVVERKQGDLVAAEAHARLGLERVGRVFDGGHPAQMSAVRNLARVLRLKGDLEQAAPLFLETLNRARQLYDPDDPRLADAESTLIEVLIESGLTEEEARRAARDAQP